MPTSVPLIKEWATCITRTRSNESASSRRTRRASSCNMITDANQGETPLGIDGCPRRKSSAAEQQLQEQQQQQQRRSSSASSTTHHSKDAGTIECRVDYFVVEDDRCAVRCGNYTGVWSGNGDRSVPQTRSRYFGDHIHQLAYNLLNKM